MFLYLQDHSTMSCTRGKKHTSKNLGRCRLFLWMTCGGEPPGSPCLNFLVNLTFPSFRKCDTLNAHYDMISTKCWAMPLCSCTSCVGSWWLGCYPKSCEQALRSSRFNLHCVYFTVQFCVEFRLCIHMDTNWSMQASHDLMSLMRRKMCRPTCVQILK